MAKTLKCLTAGLAALALVGCAPTPTTEDRIVVPEVVDDALALMVQDGRVVGVTALVFEDGEEVYAGSHGLADREVGRAMDRDAIFQIFSMTKPVTGVALMTLHEDGLFELDDPIAKYVPELADLMVYEGDDENGDPILAPPRRAPTVRDFMMHTSGLHNHQDGSYLGRLVAEIDPTEPMSNTLDDVAANFAKIPLGYHPGEEWRYSESMEMQALIVERLSGRSYADYIEEEIFSPLGMVDTSYHLAEDRYDRLARLYQRDASGEQTHVPNDFMGNVIKGEPKLTPGSWGLISTVDDYMRFALMLQNEGTLDGVQILKPETVELMRTNYLTAETVERQWLPDKGSYETIGFGLNMAVRVAPPATLEETYGVVGEFYWDGWPSTLFWIDPENDITAVFLVQQWPFDTQLHRSFRNAVYNQDRPAL